jgi:hypothetical protein
MTTDAADPAASEDSEIIARPDAGYRWKHLIMAVIMIAAGGWFAYDGWVKWPNENQLIRQLQTEKEAAIQKNDQAEIDRIAKALGQHSPHTQMDLLFQKALAFALPLAGIAYGLWTLRTTRGRYRLENDTLYVPGHQPVSIAYDIRRIDKRKWDRKGIAYLHYETGNPPVPGTIKLDDFAYERRGTDEILSRVEHHVLSAAPHHAPVPKASDA